MTTGLRRAHLLLTCEHASNRMPADLDRLGLPAAVLRQHVAWDPGALPVARLLARALDAPLLAGRWSRLVVDLNRSADHPRVIARRTLGRPIPGNRLGRGQRRERLQRLWQPWRAAAAAAVAERIAGAGCCLHLSVHSFVERLGGVERRNDVGLLYDPGRRRERAVVDALVAGLQARGISVRRNFPYFGTTDGHTSQLRRRHPARHYLGIEVELNQRRSRSEAGQRRLGQALRDALLALLPP